MRKKFFSLLILMSAIVVNAVTHPTSSYVSQDLPAIGVISVQELKEKLLSKSKVTIIDVRSSNGYAESKERIQGSIHVKLRRLKSRLTFPPLKDVPRDQEVVTYCACPSEESAIAAARILLDSGFKRVRALKGGWHEWRKMGGPVENKP